MERVRAERETEDRLDTQAAQYEERLTELHSVIAELTRKIDQQQRNSVIQEDDGNNQDDMDDLSQASRDLHDGSGKANF